jgi:hypothetical protein
MRPMPVLVMEPGQELVMALLRILIGARVSRFAKSGLDKSFGFVVGTRGVGTSEVMT